MQNEEIKIFDPTDYIVKENLRLKNLTLENYKITKMRFKKIQIRTSTLHNVIFENNFQDNYIGMEKSTFINCHFGDTFGFPSELYMSNCVFKDCLFENIRIDSQWSASGCEFKNCIFKNLDLQDCVEISYFDIEGGVMENINCLGNEITDCSFSKILLKDVDLTIALLDNEFKSVVFKNVTAQYVARTNEFLQCDTSGLFYKI